MLKTLNQIKKEFQTIADDHRQINNYYFGDFLSAMKRSDDDGQRLYKYLIVTPSTVTHSRNYTGTTLLITVCDRLLKGYEDQDDIHSDSVQILNDIYATFFGTRWQEFVDVDSDGNSTLFIDKSLDGVAGASMSISIKIYSEDNLCAIPYATNSPINPDAGCEVATITDSDGVSTFTVVSGGTGACSLAPVQSGILYRRSTPPFDSVSYATYDAKWNVDNGVYTFSNPTIPATIVELDYTQTEPQLWLKDNNAFGNKARYTLNDGTALTTKGDTTVRDYVVDHYNGYGISGVKDGTNVLWADALTNGSTHSVTVDSDTYNDFFVPSVADSFDSLTDYSERYQYTALPFRLFTSITTQFNIWTSETYGGGSGSAQSWLDGSPRTNPYSKTIVTREQIYFRKHY